MQCGSERLARCIAGSEHNRELAGCDAVGELDVDLVGALHEPEGDAGVQHGCGLVASGSIWTHYASIEPERASTPQNPDAKRVLSTIPENESESRYGRFTRPRHGLSLDGRHRQG